MLYSEYMFKAKELTIAQDSNSDLWYLDPEWKIILFNNDLCKIKEVTAPFTLTWSDVEDTLKLEAERRNKREDKKKTVIDWLYEVLTAQIEPAMMQEETEYITSMMEFMKFKAEHPEIVKSQEESATGDAKVQQLLKSGLSFSKKESV